MGIFSSLVNLQGLSFIALILLTGRLYDVDREVTFLKFVATEWLPPLPKPGHGQVETNSHIENLRTDVDSLISRFSAEQCLIAHHSLIWSYDVHIWLHIPFPRHSWTPIVKNYIDFKRCPRPGVYFVVGMDGLCRSWDQS